VDHLLGLEPAGGGDHRLAGGAAAQLPAFPHDLRAAGAVNGSVHPAATGQAAVGGVYYGVGLLLGDVAFHEHQPGAADQLFFHDQPPLKIRLA
jgi:hypothetical protein